MEIPNLNTQNGLLLKNLLEFYQKEENIKKLLQIVSGETKISLRIVDWFVTNYAKKYYVVYTIPCSPSLSSSEPSPRQQNEASFEEKISAPQEETYDIVYSRFKVYNEYKLKLKAYSKRRFDPFCRWERISIPVKDTATDDSVAIPTHSAAAQQEAHFETTIGQLNFFKWAITNHILDYIESNYEQIESDMNLRNTVSKKKNVVINNDVKTRKKREELSISACKTVKKENVEIVIKFT